MVVQGTPFQQLEDMMSSLPGCFYWKDVHGCYQGCNPDFLHLVGLKQISGKTDADLWPESAKVINKHDKEVLQYHQSTTTEERIKLQKKQEKIFIVIRTPLKDKKNNIIGILANVTDITFLRNKIHELESAQEKSEEARSSMANNLENVVACIPGSIYWKDSTGTYLGCNDHMVQEANLHSTSDIIGKTDKALWPKQAKAIRENDLEVIQSGKSVSMEETVLGRVYFSQKMPLRDEKNRIIGVVGNSHDITYLKEIEAELRESKDRLEAANNAKSEFLAVISHEFRIPLTSILGMAKLLSMQRLSLEKQHEYVQHISTAGMHLLNLINDTLDFAKLEAGKFDLALAPMDLNALIEETCTMLTPLSKAKNLELLINFEPSTPHQILGDKRVLRQIVINLIGNAIKFTEHGYVSIQVDNLEQTDTSAKLAISVSDTGIGIPKDKQNMIFDHFSQVDASHSRRYGGAGLGLTITKLLVELMGGTISVTSQIGKGSIFRCEINFPLQQESNLTPPWVPYQSSVRILIVDDTPRGEVIRKQLSPSNSQVISGKEAFNTLLASYQLADPYDIVIIDQRLININPFGLAQTIRKHDELHQAMLVLLTDDGLMSTKESAKKAGFFEFIVKPIQPLALQITLTAAWERWIEQK